MVKWAWMSCGGRRGSKWEEVRYGEMSKGVVEEFGDVGVAGGEEGGGEVNVGITKVKFCGKRICGPFRRGQQH